MTKAEALALSDIYYLPFPDTIYGCVRPLKGRFKIYINSILSEKDKEETINHELAHIMLHHFSDLRPLKEIEAEADKLAPVI